MVNLLELIISRFSGYTIALMLLSAAILLFSDRKQLKQAGLKKESGFSLGAGIVYVVITVLVAAAGIFMT